MLDQQSRPEGMRVVVLFLCLHVVVHASAVNEDFNLTWSSLGSKTNSAVHSIVRQYLPTALRMISEANISSSCERGLMTYIIALQRSKLWALEMIDATAKIPSGILRGTIMDFGEFDECLKIRVTEISRNSSRGEEKFRGRYCTVILESELLRSAVRRLEDPNYTDSYGEPPDLVKTLIKLTKVKLDIVKNIFGICIPSSCSQIDLQRISSTIIKPLGFKATVEDCHVDEPYVWPVHSVVALSSLVVLAAICALGTTLDVMKRKHKAEEGAPSDNSGTSTVSKHTSIRFLEAFSVVANSEKVMRFAAEKAPLNCLHGIRFLSATWILFGHNYVYTNKWKFESRRSVINFLDIGNDVTSGAIQSFTLAVDTFFFLSGFLLVYSTWKRMKKNDGKLNLFKFFTNKYIRMTPALCFAMTLLMLLPAIDTGPLWNSSLNPHVENCRVSWWTNFIYIANFLDADILCLDYTWYLSALMQFHILGVIILMVLYRSRTLGVILGSLLSVTCMAILLFQLLKENFSPLRIDKAKGFDELLKFASMIYLKPHFHFMCYLIGMVVAYFLLKYKGKKIYRKHQILGWCCAVGLALFSAYGIFLSDENRAYFIFYNMTYRQAWALAVGLLIYMCCSGSGGIVNRLLSWKLMHPLSQLSFMFYLVHPLVIIYLSSRQRERIYFGHSEQVFQYFSIFVASILVAFIGCITVEIPFQNLYRIITEERVREKKIENTEDNCVVMKIANIQKSDDIS